MSNEKQQDYPNHLNTLNYYLNPMLSNTSQPTSTPPYSHQNLISFEPSSHTNMTFNGYLHGSMDYNTLSRAFDMSCPSPEAASPPPVAHHHGSSNKVTNNSNYNNNNVVSSLHNSSVSSSSTEAAPEEDSGKSKSAQDHAKEGEEEDLHEEDGKSKKVNKAQKKEKREKQPRFAFLTKSDIDHLEDGYRWRKYGQKAVKNSPYPRSYYRCTTQKCNVKKRVERSFQDPTIVITTYEGQHNHQCPVSLRGNAGGAIFSSPSLLSSPSSSVPPSFPQDILSHLLPLSTIRSSSFADPAASLYYHHLAHQYGHHELQVPHDYGMLQDLVTQSGHHKKEEL